MADESDQILPRGEKLGYTGAKLQLFYDAEVARLDKKRKEDQDREDRLKKLEDARLENERKERERQDKVRELEREHEIKRQEKEIELINAKLPLPRKRQPEGPMPLLNLLPPQLKCLHLRKIVTN